MNNFITSDQSAYRNQHNTQTALHRVVDDWLYNISDGNLTGVCSFDITMAVFIPRLWDRNGSGMQPDARVHTCSTASGRSGRSRPPRDVIAVEPVPEPFQLPVTFVDSHAIIHISKRSSLHGILPQIV